MSDGFDRFFARFNLHNSVASFPPGADIFATLLNLPKEDFEKYLLEFKQIQTERTKSLIQKYGEKLDTIRGKCVVFFGDSISSDNLGYRITVSRAAELKAVDRTISGATSAMLIQDSWEILEKNRPDIVSIMMGSNDSPMLGEERLAQVSLAEYERNLSALLSWSKSFGADVLLFEVPPLHEERFSVQSSTTGKHQTNENVEKYNVVLRRVAKEYGVTVQSNQWILENPELYLEPDGLHLSKSAHDIFADKWISAALKK